jgi:hypothetical protein
MLMASLRLASSRHIRTCLEREVSLGGKGWKTSLNTPTIETSWEAGRRQATFSLNQTHKKVLEGPFLLGLLRRA